MQMNWSADDRAPTGRLVFFACCLLITAAAVAVLPGSIPESARRVEAMFLIVLLLVLSLWGLIDALSTTIAERRRRRELD